MIHAAAAQAMSVHRDSEGVLGRDASTMDDEVALAAAADEAEADHASLCALLDWESSGHPALQLTPSAGPLRRDI